MKTSKFQKIEVQKRFSGNDLKFSGREKRRVVKFDCNSRESNIMSDGEYYLIFA